DLDEAHAAHADRLHALVPAEPRDVRAVLLCHANEQLAARRLHRLPVDGYRDRVVARRHGDHVPVVRRPLAHRHGIGRTGGPAHADATFSTSRRSKSRVRRSTISSRKKRSRLTTWLITLGPSAQIVVCENGALRPGTMLLPNDSSRSRSSGRPCPCSI